MQPPRLASLDERDCLGCDPIAGGEFVVGFCRNVNFTCVTSSDLEPLLPNDQRHPTKANAVLGVVGPRAFVNVIWIDATCDIAPMASKEPRSNRSPQPLL